MIYPTKEEIKERIKAIRRDFAQRYGSDAIRQKLWRTQAHVCSLGGKPIADIFFARVDHRLSVFDYASMAGLTQEQMLELANTEDNLCLVCERCNAKKAEADLEENPQLVFDCSDEPLKLDAEQIAAIKAVDHKRRSARAKKGWATINPEARSARLKKGKATMGPERRSAAYKKRLENMGPERLSAASKKRLETLGSEGLSALGKKIAETLGPEGLSARAKKIAENIGPEGCSARAKKREENMKKSGSRHAAIMKRVETMGPERLSAAAKKREENMSPEARSARAKKAYETRRRKAVSVSE